MDIRATAKCPEIIPSGFQERQSGAATRRITKGEGIAAFCVTAAFAHRTRGLLAAGLELG
jgi:hypothetical protein